jgi:hypothetical protein
MKIQNKFVFRTTISVFLYFQKKMHESGMIARSRHVGHARPRRGADMIARPKRLALARYLIFFLNNTSEVHKELLVRCPKII